MKPFVFMFIFCILFLVSCSSPKTSQNSISQSKLYNTNSNSSIQEIILDSNFKPIMGQTIYVPIYSHIYYENAEKSLDLAATISIRNTDLSNSIIIKNVRYYDTEGNFLKDYIEKPVQIQRLGTINFVVNRTDRSGGSGANFIVEWISQTKVSEPIIEAVMISATGNQSISFISQGKVIKKSP